MFDIGSNNKQMSYQEHDWALHEILLSLLTVCRLQKHLFIDFECLSFCYSILGHSTRYPVLSLIVNAIVGVSIDNVLVLNISPFQTLKSIASGGTGL